MVAGLLMTFVGKLYDVFSPKIMIPSTILARGGCFALIWSIKDPRSWSFYLIVPLMHLVYHSSAVSISSYQQSMYPKEVRGLMTSVSGIISSIGAIAYQSLFQWSFKTHGPAGPFITYAISNVCVATFVILLSCCNLFGNKFDADK